MREQSPPISDLQSPIAVADHDETIRIDSSDRSVALRVADREIRARRDERAPDFYQAYLNSPAWRVTRNRALRLVNYTCQQCGSRRRLEVHHLTYVRLGNELDADLEVLCFTCHNGHHLEEAPANPVGIYTKVVSEVLQRDPFARITDLVDEVKVLCAQRRIPQRFDLIDRAVSLVCGTRLHVRGVPAVPMADVAPHEPLTPAQAIECLARIRVKLGLAEISVKPIVAPEKTTQRELDRARAMAMVVGELEASVERCATLEAAIGGQG